MKNIATHKNTKTIIGNHWKPICPQKSPILNVLLVIKSIIVVQVYGNIVKNA
jgi:hypothetical protein